VNALGGILGVADVALDVAADSRDALLAFAADLLSRNHGLPAPEVRAALAAREGLGCTALGHGFALPHARMPGLAKPAAAFVRTKSPIAFGATEARPVAGFLVLLVPAQAAEEHLNLLAEAAALLNDPSFRAAVRGADDAAEVAHLFAQWPIANDAT
jgi:PTS system nitrogen regulatory IIA component